MEAPVDHDFLRLDRGWLTFDDLHEHCDAHHVPNGQRAGHLETRQDDHLRVYVSGHVQAMYQRAEGDSHGYHIADRMNFDGLDGNLRPGDYHAVQDDDHEDQIHDDLEPNIMKIDIAKFGNTQNFQALPG